LNDKIGQTFVRKFSQKFLSKILNNEKTEAEILEEDKDKEEYKQESLEGLTNRTYTFSQLNKGSLFGEIGIITKLKRTATIKSVDYCTFAEMKKS
jgi:CRP-like cAMP-binding protein